MPETKNVDKEMQERLLAYRMLENRLRGLSQQRELISSKVLEIQGTLAGIEDTMKSKGDVIFSLGSAAYVKGNVKDRENIIVEVGAGIALEKSMDDAKATLEKRLKELESVFSKVQSEMSRMSSAMSELQSSLETLTK
jgi:prefoldin alpha subunit